MYRNHIDPKADLENEIFQSELFSDSEEFSDKIKMEIFQSEKDYIGASSKMKVNSCLSNFVKNKQCSTCVSEWQAMEKKV